MMRAVLLAVSLALLGAGTLFARSALDMQHAAYDAPQIGAPGRN